MNKTKCEKDGIVIGYIISKRPLKDYAIDVEVHFDTLYRWTKIFKDEHTDWERLCKGIEVRQAMAKESLRKCPCSRLGCQNKSCMNLCEDYEKWLRWHRNK